MARPTGYPTCSRPSRGRNTPVVKRVATTNGLHRPEVLTDEEAMDLMKRQYERIIETAAAYEVVVTIEVHGYFTTKPEYLERMLAFVDSP
jgi:inosose dehydratase